MTILWEFDENILNKVVDGLVGSCNRFIYERLGHAESFDSAPQRCATRSICDFFDLFVFCA
jgi:hypothetical protein